MRKYKLIGLNENVMFLEYLAEVKKKHPDNFKFKVKASHIVVKVHHDTDFFRLGDEFGRYCLKQYAETVQK